MGVQRDSTSAIHRLQESLRFSEEGSIVQYSRRVWGIHETSQAKCCHLLEYSAVYSICETTRGNIHNYRCENRKSYIVRLIKICLNEMYSKVHVVKYLFNNFPTQNGLKQGDALTHCFSALFENMPLRRLNKTRCTEIK
jgi:hypothetical protein